MCEERWFDIWKPQVLAFIKEDNATCVATGSWLLKGNHSKFNWDELFDLNLSIPESSRYYYEWCRRN